MWTIFIILNFIQSNGVTLPLLRNITISWEALVHYFKKYPKKAEDAGSLRYIKTINSLKTIAFFAEVVFTYQRFQKITESDRLKIIPLISNIALLRKKTPRKNVTSKSPLLGGFKQNLVKQIYWCSANGKTILKFIESRRETNSFIELREEILSNLQTEFLERKKLDQTTRL